MEPDTLAARLPALLRGVHPGWISFFEERGLMDAARQALAAAEPDADALAPAEGLVFEPFRYGGPDDARVVILGQDPYPQDAQGLCFSKPHGQPLKDSLKTIFGNLEAHALARPHFRVADDPSSGVVVSGELRLWAAQGVLLINAAFTNRAGARGAHRGAWKAFTGGLIEALSARAAAAGRPLVFMLWGGDARAFAPRVRHGPAPHPVYQWTHPSPMSNNALPPASKFEAAPHFADANAALRAGGLRPIVWDPLELSLAFTDGSCENNGAANAKASFAAEILGGPLKGVRVAGCVRAAEYAFVDPADPRRGFAPTAKKAAPTNNRGEYLAWCWVLLLLLRGGGRGRVEVVSDCDLFIKTMTEWLPARRAKGREGELKNLDLVLIAERLLAELRAAVGLGDGGVRLTHVNSHTKRPGPDAGPRAQVLWIGNDRVDRAAAAVRGTGEELVFAAEAPALEWCLLKRYG